MMILEITIRKVVDDREEGRQLFELVKERIKDHPDLKIRGKVTNRFIKEREPPE